ncbi:MAG: ADP-ribosylglycohydrolase family protein [Clostridiales Family XIII bacterium]|jgi:ADP-ribosylglycohydrolase|nr:ADP-ribosylglycohydrolase family protein [Clostridiales Family XIII bacterium]
MKISKAHFRGCLLGGATADAKGYGVKEGGKDLISDNTQMTCFTVDGLIWADERAIRKGVYAYVPCLFYAYQKWYYTQTGNLADKNYGFLLRGEILEWEALFARRGTGQTSMTALGGSIKNKYGTLKNRINNSKGCGSVMRVAPIGMYFWKNEEMAFRIGAESGALTHGHIDAILSSGYYAAFIANILMGASIKEAVLAALRRLKEYKGHEDCTVIIEKAIALAQSNLPVNRAMEDIGEGYTAEEATALAVFLSLRYTDDFDGAILAATTFNGNTDSIAPITGNALGAYHGDAVIPQKWINELELADLIVHGADLLLTKVDMEDLQYETL